MCELGGEYGVQPSGGGAISGVGVLVLILIFGMMFGACGYLYAKPDKVCMQSPAYRLASPLTSSHLTSSFSSPHLSFLLASPRFHSSSLASQAAALRAKLKQLVGLGRARTDVGAGSKPHGIEPMPHIQTCAIADSQRFDPARYPQSSQVPAWARA